MNKYLFELFKELKMSQYNILICLYIYSVCVCVLPYTVAIMLLCTEKSSAVVSSVLNFGEEN